jgi:nicotinate-nucleotide pyrophosphorylase (carboxylating)
MNDINCSIAAQAASAIDAISSRYGLPLATAVTRNAAAMLGEDVGSGDLSGGLIDAATSYRARVISRESAILCGTPWFNEVVRQVDPSIAVRWLHQDGDRVVPDAVLVELEGPAKSLLTAERSALNFVQMLSGVATATRTFVDAVAGTRARIVDTRKTIPGLRLAQKYAVAVGGGENHRLGLYDAILLKENHIAALGGVGPAVDATRADKGARFVQVEVESLEQLEVALAHGATSILLDNFSLDMMTAAVATNAGRAMLEASGNVNMNTVVAIAKTGVDRISIGALTKDVRAVDLSMRFTADVEQGS